MQEASQDKNLQFDTKVLSKFIYALNIARQHVGGYPADHPIIAGSTTNVLRLLGNLLEFQEFLTLGVFRDTLLVAGATLDVRNPVYRKLAEELFDLGIAALTFRRSLTRSELIRLLKLICRGRDPESDQQQLIEQLRALDLNGLQVKLIDYSAFAATDEDSLKRGDRHSVLDGVSLWDRFIEGMIEGTIDPTGKVEDLEDRADPQLLAAFLSRQRAAAEGKEASYEESITNFLRELDQEGLASNFRTEALDKLSIFVDGLSADLRRQFLSSTFNTLGSDSEIAEQVMSHLSSEALFQALDDVNAKRLTIPPAIMNLLGKFSQHSGEQSDLDYAKTQEALSSAELGEHLRSLFQEDDPDRFIPGTYQHLLHSIVSAEDIPPLDGRDTEELRYELLEQSAEKQLCHITLELLRSTTDPQQRKILADTLHELMIYFLETGEFSFIVNLHEGMRRGGKKKAGGEELEATLLQKEFLREVLATLGVWGKDKFTAITELINKIGTPFIEPMLDQLAVEKRMSLRRFFMVRLGEMGGAVREPILARLRDTRWYFVRNLIVLLRDLADPVTLHALRTMVRHPHAQVRLEVAKTLLKFNDPGVDRFVLDELGSGDLERIKQGLAFADKRCSPELLPALLNLLERKDNSATAWAQKHTAIRLLGRLGNPEALPVLESVLLSKNLLHARQLARVKTAIVRSLSQYPRRDVQPILELQQANGGEIGALAQEILQSKARKTR